MSPTTTRTRPSRNDCSASLFVTTWLSSDLVKHVLTSQCFSDCLRLVFGQGMLRISTRDLEDAVVKHHHSQRAESHTRGDQDLIHVVDSEATGLFDPILDEGVAQSVLGLRLGEIRAFDNETIFQHFYGLV